ncbi:MAG: Transporter [Burkholderia sp.]
MHSKHFLRAALSAALLSTAAGSVFAGGFQLTEQSALSLGRAYAGAGVDGKDISGIYYNPATMTLHPGSAIQIGGTAIGLNLDFRGEKNGQYVEENGRQKTQVLPFGYVSKQLTDRVWAGLAITVPFGMGTKYDTNWAFNDHGVAAQIYTIDFNPNLAWKLTDKFSVGAGFSVQYVNADLKTVTYQTDLKTVTYQSYGPYKIPVTSKLRADDVNVGFNLGAMWSPYENLRFGVSFRSNVQHHADGDMLLTINALNYNGQIPASASVQAPAWIMANAAWDVNDWLSLYATFRWTDWSSFDEIEMKSGGTVVGSLTNNWKDTYFMSGGADFRITSRFTLRGGIGYETSPISNKYLRTAIIPDTDRWWFSGGLSYQWTEKTQIDTGFVHLHGVHERNLYGSDGSTLGKFRKLDAFIFGLQMVHKF